MYLHVAFQGDIVNKHCTFIKILSYCVHLDRVTLCARSEV